MRKEGWLCRKKSNSSWRNDKRSLTTWNNVFSTPFHPAGHYFENQVLNRRVPVVIALVKNVAKRLLLLRITTLTDS